MLRKNIQKIKKLLVSLAILILMVTLLLSQENQLSYLSQKLLLENNLRQRITNALDKLLDDIKFVVDARVEIVFTPIEQTKIIYHTPQAFETEEAVTKKSGQEYKVKKEKRETAESEQVEPGVSLPLPGFEMPQSVVTETRLEKVSEKAKELVELQEKPTAEEVITEVVALPSEAQVVSKSIQKSTIPIPMVKRQEITVILEDGVTPDIIENVRQVVAVAAHYDRSRGDIISIQTASFRRRKGEEAAEAIILKNIAEKIDNLERRQTEAERKAKIEEQKRIERRAVIRDSLRIAELSGQIEDLQMQLQAPQLTDEQRQLKEVQAITREQELANLKRQLRESNRRLQELEMGIIETTPPGTLGLKSMGIYIAIGIVALALLIVLLIVLLTRKSRAQRQEMEWGYGSKIPMGARPEQPVAQPEAPKQAAEVLTAEPRPEAPSPPPPQKKPKVTPEDIAARQEEMRGMKQSIISMSVGQPDAASSIIDEWLSQEAQPGTSESELEEGEV